ncbi:HAMP domain-containing sensor histidine kinase [uncultured Gilvimarinus sp.]|uniref:sensor histidine kinase n=1 Tax=uncultured Gilvimarinus sp. TaxID=1689143 RepID=UPI0030D85587
MDNYKVNPFKQTFAVMAGGFLFIIGYFVYSSVSYHHSLIKSKSEYLQGFTERSLTRVKANPHWYLDGEQRVIGDKKTRFITQPEQLAEYIGFQPEKDELKVGVINLFITQFRGLFSISDFLLIYPFIVDGKTYYSYFSLTPEVVDADLTSHLKARLQPAVFAAVFLVALLFAIQFRQLQRVNKLVTDLAQWADNLSTKRNFQPLPKTQGKSMNYIAHTMNASLATFSNLLEKEYSFARFTSHELRTQVAVLSANMEILELIMKDLNDEEKRVLSRMFIAVEDMKYQTEALLWLSKETENSIDITEFDVNDAIEKAISENNHIIKSKPVKIICTGNASYFKSNLVLFQIAVNNLVRNAFQNTDEGTVHIASSNNGFSIVNTNATSMEERDRKDGFGIGLILVERIVEKLNLAYKAENLVNGRVVEVTFKSKPERGDIANNDDFTSA